MDIKTTITTSLYSADFQPFSSHGTLIIKILQHTQKYIVFADLTKSIRVTLIHSHRTADVGAVLTFSNRPPTGNAVSAPD